TQDMWLHDCALAVNAKLVVREGLALYRLHGLNAAGGLAVIAGVVANRWRLLRHRFLVRLSLNKQAYVPDSPIAQWLLRQREALIAGHYIDEARLSALVALENSKVDVLRERHRLLQLPRWRRFVGVMKLLLSGNYARFFSWKSALKDLIKP